MQQLAYRWKRCEPGGSYLLKNHPSDPWSFSILQKSRTRTCLLYKSSAQTMEFMVSVCLQLFFGGNRFSGECFNYWKPFFQARLVGAIKSKELAFELSMTLSWVQNPPGL